MRKYIIALCVLGIAVAGCSNQVEKNIDEVPVPPHSASVSGSLERAISPTKKAQQNNKDAIATTKKVTSSTEEMISIFELTDFANACDPAVTEELGKLRFLTDGMNSDMKKLQKTLFTQEKELEESRISLEVALVKAKEVQTQRDDAIQSLKMANSRLGFAELRIDAANNETAMEKAKLEEALKWKHGVLWFAGGLVLFMILGLVAKSRGMFFV
jgi:copper chaperone CopZ